jgi:hypothetical protein
MNRSVRAPAAEIREFRLRAAGSISCARSAGGAPTPRRRF